MAEPPDGGPVAVECVEGYLYVPAPFALLLLRRPPARGRLWVPVSGRIEPTDADRPSALRREIAEELGFALPEPPVPLDWHVPFTGPDGRAWRLHAYAVALDGRYAPTLSDEHDAYRWADAVTARAALHYPDNRAALDRLLARLAADRRPAPAGDKRFAAPGT